MRRALIVTMFMSILAIAALCAVPSAAAAAAVTAPVADCSAHGKLTRHYSTAELETAVSTMPADISEYTDCAEVIQGQLLAQLGQSKVNDGTAAGSGGSFLPVPVVVAIVVLALAAVALGAVALLRRKQRSP